MSHEFEVTINDASKTKIIGAPLTAPISTPTAEQIAEAEATLAALAAEKKEEAPHAN